MSLEEKFKDLMKTYQTIASSNLELVNQNTYLRCQTEETKKQMMRVKKRSSRSIHEEDGESSSYSFSLLREKESDKNNPIRNGVAPLTLMILESNYENSKENLI